MLCIRNFFFFNNLWFNYIIFGLYWTPCSRFFIKFDKISSLRFSSIIFNKFSSFSTCSLHAIPLAILYVVANKFLDIDLFIFLTIFDGVSSLRESKSTSIILCLPFFLCFSIKISLGGCVFFLIDSYLVLSNLSVVYFLGVWECFSTDCCFSHGLSFCKPLSTCFFLSLIHEMHAIGFTCFSFLSKLSLDKLGSWKLFLSINSFHVWFNFSNLSNTINLIKARWYKNLSLFGGSFWTATAIFVRLFSK